MTKSFLVGDRFFQKERNFIIIILSIEEHWYNGITDRQIEEKEYRTNRYHYADLADLKQLKPASEFDLRILALLLVFSIDPKPSLS